MKKICPGCERRFNFEDDEYRYCPYCTNLLKPFFFGNEVHKYNPSRRDSPIDKNFIVLKKGPWADGESCIDNIEEY